MTRGWWAAAGFAVALTVSCVIAATIDGRRAVGVVLVVALLVGITGLAVRAGFLFLMGESDVPDDEYGIRQFPRGRCGSSPALFLLES